MPLYEYRCKQCGQVFEKIQRFSDEPLTIHEECGGSVERLLSAPALQFKGSGWYITDYAKGGSGKKNGKPSTTESKPSTDASGSTGSSSSSSSSSPTSEKK